MKQIDYTEVTIKLMDEYTSKYLQENAELVQDTIKATLEAINYSQCCTELKSDTDQNFKFRNEDFKYSEFIKGVGKEYNYVLGNKHYFVNGELVKIL